MSLYSGGLFLAYSSFRTVKDSLAVLRECQLRSSKHEGAVLHEDVGQTQLHR